MKKEDYSNLSIKDIEQKIFDEKSQYELLRLNHKMSQIENPIQLREMRRNIARLNTVLANKKNANKA